MKSIMNHVIKYLLTIFPTSSINTFSISIAVKRDTKISIIKRMVIKISSPFKREFSGGRNDIQKGKNKDV